MRRNDYPLPRVDTPLQCKLKKERMASTRRRPVLNLFSPVDHPPHSNTMKRVIEQPTTRESRYLTKTRLMRSERWFPDSRTKVRERGIPFVDNGGHITGSCTMTWKCSSAQWYATCIRSVLHKLKKRMKPGNPKYGRPSLDLVTRIAVFYVTTLDDAALERLVRCRTKYTRGLLYHYWTKVDAQQRFCYGQILQSISWLQSRGKPRAKSITKCYSPEYRRIGLRSYDARREIKTYLHWLSDHWIVGPVQLIKSAVP